MLDVQILVNRGDDIRAPADSSVRDMPRVTTVIQHTEKYYF